MVIIICKIQKSIRHHCSLCTNKNGSTMLLTYAPTAPIMPSNSTSSFRITPPPHGQHSCHHTALSVKRQGDESLFCVFPTFPQSNCRLPHYCRSFNQQQHSTIPNGHWRISQRLKPTASIVHHKDLSEDDASVATTSFCLWRNGFDSFQRT